MCTPKTGIILLIGLAAVGGFYVACINPASFGLYHDDGIYVVCAKSLATGQGYRIISLPHAPWQTKYPPFYPLLLSGVWRLYPDFPANLFPMMLLSVVAALAFLGMTYRYLTALGYADRGLALCVVALTALNWKCAIVASGVYSEMIYAFLSVLTLYQIERYAAEDRPSRLPGLLAGLSLGLLILTRTAGVTLLLAGVFYLVYRRRWRGGLYVGGVASLFLLAWVLWSHAHPARTTVATATYLHWYTDYIADFRSLVPDGKTFLRVLKMNAFYFFFLIPTTVLGFPNSQLTGSLFFQGMVLFSGLIISLGFVWESWGRLRLLALYVFLYLALCCAYPYLIDRYFLPVLPFLLLYLFRGFARLGRMPLRGRTAAPEQPPGRWRASLTVLFFAALMLVYSVNLRVLFYNRFLRRAQEKREYAVQEWIRRHTDASDILACYQDPAYYLYTGRRAIRSLVRERSRMMRVYYQTPPAPSPPPSLLNVMRDLGATYLIMTENDFALEAVPELRRAELKEMVAHAPEVFTLIFQSADGSARIYQINSAP